MLHSHAFHIHACMLEGPGCVIWLSCQNLLEAVT